MIMGQRTGFWFGSDVEILLSGWPKNYGYFHFFVALVLVFVISVVAQMCSMTPMSAPKMSAKGLIHHAAMHGFKTLMSYLVLLCVITFNAGVIMMVLFGHVAGYIGCNLSVKSQFPAAVATPPANDAKA